jgi:hypothetical protein
MFRFHMPFGIVYRTEPATLAGIPALLQAEAESRGHRYVNAWLKAFGPSSIDFDFAFEVDGGDPASAHKAFEAVALGVLAALKAQGIEFAYPAQTTFTAAPDGTLVMPYSVPAKG